MASNGQLIKNTSDLIQCQIKDCLTSDVFLIGKFANQSFYKIEHFNIYGNVTVKSIYGETRSVISVNGMVYRKKRLCEYLVNVNDKVNISMFGVTSEVNPSHFENKEIIQSNKLLDRIDCKDEIDLISLLF